MTPAPPGDAATGPRFAGAAMLLAAVAIAYAGVLAGPFQFDDWWSIVDNPSVHSLRAWWEALPGIRPLLKFANALNWTLAPTAAAFHAVNMVVHAANVVLLWALLHRWTPVLAPRSPRPAFAAFATAALFALHPAATEAVAYVGGRSVSLAATFQLVTLLALGAARDGRGGARWLAAAAFAAAVGVRETALVVPFAWLLLSRCAGDDARTALRPLRGVAVVAAAAVVAAVATDAYDRFLAVSVRTREPLAQLLAQLDAHLYLLTNPLPGRVLNIDPDVAVPAGFMPRHAAVLALAAGAAVLAWRRRMAMPWLAFALGWYVLHLLPTNSLVPRLDIVNDRHLYLALAGPVLVVALGIAALPRRAGGVALAGLALAAGLRTADRVDDYRSEVALWTATVAHSPDKARPWANLGHALAATGDEDGAADAFRCALARDPGYTQARWNLAALGATARTRPPGPCEAPPASSALP